MNIEEKITIERVINDLYQATLQINVKNATPEELHFYIEAMKILIDYFAG